MNTRASLCLLSKLEIQAREQLEGRQASSSVIGRKLGFNKSIHNGVASFEHLPKTKTDWYQDSVVSNIETPNAA